MAKFIVTVEVEVDEEWAAEGVAFIDRQIEKMIDNNAGGHASACVVDVKPGETVEDIACRYEVQLQSNGTPKCGFAAGTWFQTAPFMDDYTSQADAEAAVAAYAAEGELRYLPLRIVMIQTIVAVASA